MPFRIDRVIIVFSLLYSVESPIRSLHRSFRTVIVKISSIFRKISYSIRCYINISTWSNKVLGFVGAEEYLDILSRV